MARRFLCSNSSRTWLETQWYRNVVVLILSVWVATWPNVLLSCFHSSDSLLRDPRGREAPCCVICVSTECSVSEANVWEMPRIYIHLIRDKMNELIRTFTNLMFFSLFWMIYYLFKTKKQLIVLGVFPSWFIGWFTALLIVMPILTLCLVIGAFLCFFC